MWCRLWRCPWAGLTDIETHGCVVKVSFEICSSSSPVSSSSSLVKVLLRYFLGYIATSKGDDGARELALDEIIKVSNKSNKISEVSNQISKVPPKGMMERVNLHLMLVVLKLLSRWKSTNIACCVCVCACVCATHGKRLHHYTTIKKDILTK